MDVEMEKTTCSGVDSSHPDGILWRGWGDLRHALGASQDPETVLSLEILAKLPGRDYPQRAFSQTVIAQYWGKSFLRDNL